MHEDKYNLKISTLTNYRKLTLTQIGRQSQGRIFTYPKLLYIIALIILTRIFVMEFLN